jgi:hypothetical protein
MVENDDIVPLTKDLRDDTVSFDVIKGSEHLNVMDGKLDSAYGECLPGMWVVKTASGVGKAPAGAGVSHVYPVMVGNNQYDAKATGNVTYIQGGGFIYRTNQFDPAPATPYAVGGNLTVKDGAKVPTSVGSSDAIVARIHAYDATKKQMDIEVLNR